MPQATFSIRVKLLTLAFCPARSGFDTGPLDAFLAEHQLLALREYLFDAHGAPHVLCVLTYRTAVDQAAGPPATPQLPRPAPADLAPAESQRFAQLRAWRSARARQDGVPPYVIFHDRELADIAKRRPASLNALGELRGVGPGKLARYGTEVLATLQDREPTPPPAEAQP